MLEKMNELKLIENHMKLARIIAKKYFKTHSRVVEYEDVEQESYYRLIKASEGYNDTLGIPFTVYVSTIIRRGLNRFYAQFQSVVSCGSDSKSEGLLRKIVYDSNGTMPEAYQIIAKYQTTKYNAKNLILKYRSQNLLRLDKQLLDSDSCVMDILDFQKFKNPSEMYERKDLEEYLYELLKEMPMSWKSIIDKRYFKEMSLIIIGNENGVSPQAIKQNINRIIKFLNKRMEE